MKKTQHFLTLNDFSSDELYALIYRAITLKQQHNNGIYKEPLKHLTLAMLFDKASTRTRVSFEVGMTQLGGHAMFLSPRDTQLGRGEPLKDSARVISRMADIIMIRTYSHDMLEHFAEHSSVPVINALTDKYHPCQLLADVMTYVEHRGSIRDKTVTWIGDGNNMCHSWMNAARQFGFRLNIACPADYQPDAEIIKRNQSSISFLDVEPATKQADLVVTDVWASMGQEEEQKIRRRAFKNYQVNAALMRNAKDDALFMHCLPAHREEEVTEEVLEGKQSVVWDEAENRLHAQKALLETLALGAVQAAPASLREVG